MGDLTYETTNNNRTTNLLLYGNAKTRKTTWCGMAAAMGLHVYIFDGDKGADVLMQLPKDLHKFIHIINCWDEPGGANFQEFVARFIKRSPFYWNDTKRRTEAYLGKPFSETDSYWFIQPKLINPSMFITIDSWTKLVISITMNYAMSNKIDLSNPEQLESDKWTYFRHAGTIADFALNQFHGMNSHIAIVGHKTVYEKRGENAEGKTVIESQHTQPISVSGPHAMKLAGLFDHVLLFGVNLLGDVQIDLRASAAQDGGSRSMKPQLYNFNNLKFEDILKASHINPIIDLPQDAFIFYPPGEVNKHVEENKKFTLGGGKKSVPGNTGEIVPVKSGTNQSPLSIINIGNKNG